MFQSCKTTSDSGSLRFLACGGVWAPSSLSFINWVETPPIPEEKERNWTANSQNTNGKKHKAEGRCEKCLTSLLIKETELKQPWDTSLQLPNYQMFKWDVLKQTLWYTAGRTNGDSLSVKQFTHIYREPLKEHSLPLTLVIPFLRVYLKEMNHKYTHI